MPNANDIPQLAVREDELYKIRSNYAITAKKRLAIFRKGGHQRDILGNGVLLNDDGAKDIRVSLTELHKLGDLRSGSIDPWPGEADQTRWNKKIKNYEIAGEAMDLKRGVESREGMWEDALPEGITGIGSDDLDALFVDEDTDEEMQEEYLAADYGSGVEEGGDEAAGGQDEAMIAMYVDENGDQGEQQVAPGEMHQKIQNNEMAVMYPCGLNHAHLDSIGGSFFDENGDQGEQQVAPGEIYQNNQSNEMAVMYPYGLNHAHFDSIGGSSFNENGDQGKHQVAPGEMYQNNENHEMAEFMNPYDLDHAHPDTIGGSFFGEAFQNGSYLDPPLEDMPFEPGPYMRTLHMG